MPVMPLQMEKIISLAKAYGATRLILFESAAQNLSEARDTVNSKLNEYLQKLELQQDG